ncbi:endoglucanase 9-like [Neltuma alba]|uniref:endoglucanase 9-like n=1 Tax=Neltuma alba TaxID=207710 RepID=UPI0010A40B92|nr:endoglucanase 9-like [Prosopis alba]
MFRFFFFIIFFLVNNNAEGNPDNYSEALEKSLLFFPHVVKIVLLSHGDLTGGCNDAGENVKFNFPTAFTATMFSGSTVEYGWGMGSQIQEAQVGIRWATDYLLKGATATPPARLYVGAGDPNVDHKCWERPEDMDAVRTVYWVSHDKPGSEVAGEIAAALTAASIVFHRADPAYSRIILRTAKKVFKFALKYQGSYNSSLGSAVCPSYCSYNGCKDELLRGAAWLFRTPNSIYYNKLIKNLGADDQLEPDIFSWDNKYAGKTIKLARRALLNHDENFDQYRQEAENFVCKILPNSPNSTTQYTKGGGNIYDKKIGANIKLPQSNLQYAGSTIQQNYLTIL